MSSGSKINLLQMQNYFEEQIDKVRIISDLELSENDYRSLSAKLKAFSFFTGSENDIEDYILSIVIHSVYTLIYGNDSNDFDSVIHMFLNKSQYAERMRLVMFRDAFYSYNMNTFEITDSDLRSLCQKIAARHAGVPNSDKKAFYDLISGYLECTEVGKLYESIYEQLPKRTRFIFDLMDEDMRREVLFEARAMISEVVDGILTRNELMQKYNMLSISLIDRCIMWNEDNNQQIGFHIH